MGLHNVAAIGAVWALACVAPHCATPATPPPSPSATVASPPNHRSAASVLEALRATTGLADFARGTLVERDSGWVRGGAFRPASHRAQLARTADGALRIETLPDFWIEVRATDLASVSGEASEGALLFADAAPETDVVQGLVSAGAEELRILRSAGARSETRWAFDVGPAVARVTIDGGRVSLLDASGVPRIATTPIFAVDARGLRRDLRVRLEGERALVATLDTAGLEYPIVVDPTWTAANLPDARARHVAFGLNGHVVLIGGHSTAAPLTTTDFFTASPPAWSVGPLSSSAHDYAAGAIVDTGSTKLGTVGLVAGGDSVSAAEYWDGAYVRFYGAGAMSTARKNLSLVALTGGFALATGGTDTTSAPLASAELWDSTTLTSSGGAGKWTLVGPMTTARTSHASLPVTVAGAQMALVVGGTASSASSPPPLASAELYDPTTKTFTATGSMATARSGFGMVALANGKILVVGGIDPTIATGDQALASCEIYDPATGLWSAAASLSRPRNASVSVLLKNGNVLTTGGTQFVKSGTGTVISYLLSTEIYDPIADAWTAGPPMLSAHVGHTATALANGEVLIAGGQANLATVSGDGEIFSDAGLACTTSAQCGTGFCVDGVCCASACTDPCGACNLPSSLGTCAAVTGATVGTTRVACSGAGTDCGLQCTGASTTCAYPTAAITCGAATCASGSATHVGTCDGKGDCTASPPEACAPYVCGATACKSACATSNDCATGFTCSTGVCAAASTKCSTDGTSQIDADGSVHSCAPYLCDGSSNTCSPICTTSSDCISGDICDTASRSCTSASAGGGSSGGCTINASTIADDAGGARGLAFAIAAMLLARRRHGRR